LDCKNYQQQACRDARDVIFTTHFSKEWGRIRGIFETQRHRGHGESRKERKEKKKGRKQEEGREQGGS
jgi:hypothetical protein